MGTGSLDNEKFRPDRPKGVGGILWLLLDDLRVRIPELIDNVRQTIEHFFASSQHENQLAAPEYAHHFAGLHRPDRHFHRCAKRLRPSARLQRREKRNCRYSCASQPGYSGRNGQKVTSVSIQTISVVVHQALLYARLRKGWFLEPLYQRVFCFISILVDLQQTRFGVRMTIGPGSISHYTRAVPDLARQVATTT